MRTTIEMTDEQRARLLHLAARRGLKGFSTLVQEALDIYLQRMESRSEAHLAAASLRGALSKKEADEMEDACQRLRGQWR